MSLGLSVLRGGLWNFLEQFLKRGITAASALILSYFLAPEEFGLISMLSLFLALAGGLMDAGLRDALLRRRHLSTRLLDTAFWSALALGLFAYALLWLCAPLVADFYAQPRLSSLIRVIGLTVIFNALQIAPAARLANALDFKAFIAASFPASIISSLFAIALASLDFGAWSLVAQMLSASLITAALLWRRAGWPLSPRLDFKPLQILYGFGYKLFLSNLIAIVVRNAAPAVIGKFLGAVLAGYYYFVDKIMEVVMGQLVYSIQNVSYPALARISASDGQLKNAYRKLVEITVFVVSPCLAIAAGIADPLFAFIFPERWQPAVSCFRWLCAVYLMYPLHAINLNILKVKGRSDIFLQLEIVKAAIALAMLFVSVRYGLIALLAGQLLTSLLCYIPNSYYSRRLIDYPVQEQMRDVLPYFLTAALSGCLAYAVSRLVTGWPLPVVVLLSAAGGGLAFLAANALFRLRAMPLLRQTLRARAGGT